MALFQYFMSMNGQYPGSKFPDSLGELSQVVRLHAISAANNQVATICQCESQGKVQVPENECQEGRNMKASSRAWSVSYSSLLYKLHSLLYVTSINLLCGCGVF